MRAAILDLGTNTFQLLIAERLNDDVIFLHRDEQWVGLAEESAERIGDAALRRMESVLLNYREVISFHRPDLIHASGTAAFRNALNAADAIALVKRVIGMAPKTITGEEEAQLIYIGVCWAAGDIDATVLVMDIGGGSTEFIIGKRTRILWKKSYPLGATLLRKKFQPSDPITNAERNVIDRHIINLTDDLQFALTQHEPTVLIGASGSFDSFAAMMHCDTGNALVEMHLHEIQTLLQTVVQSRESERAAMPGLVAYRVKPIVAAAVLTQIILRMFKPEKVYRSAYALNEGRLRRLLFDEP